MNAHLFAGNWSVPAVVEGGGRLSNTCLNEVGLLVLGILVVDGINE